VTRRSVEDRVRRGRSNEDISGTCGHRVNVEGYQLPPRQAAHQGIVSSRLPGFRGFGPQGE